MKTTLIIIWIGNLIDTLATLYFTNLGFTELNPIVYYLLQWPVVFVAVKLTIMLIFTYVFWLAREMKMAIVMSKVACIIYTTIAIYYIFSLFVILLA